MKNLYYSFILILITFSTVNAQDPTIEWQNTIGGNDIEAVQGDVPFFQLPDGGYIIGAGSNSNISGNKTENSNGNFDYWLVRLDNSGSILWQNTIGGNQSDFIGMISQTSDSGFILGGSSSSDISGDKTENSRGLNDYWIVKVNSSGVIQWDKTIGGNSNDALTSINQTSDGGYILGGNSSSGISGDKTEASIGAEDYWVMKLDSSGNIVWQNTIGGSATDELFSMSETSDGGYIVGGHSYSGISGDKTENSNGTRDLWILKLDSLGNIIWQNTIGGDNDDGLSQISELSSSGYIIAGSSKSNISGDKTENSYNGSNDYWLIKISSTGNIVWQNTIGGNGFEILQNALELPDGSFVLGGWSNSAISGDKIENSTSIDFWILKVDSLGNIVSQNTINASGTDIIRSTSLTNDGGYILLGESDSNISGDKTVNSIASNGKNDLWVLKLTSNALSLEEFYSSNEISLFRNPVSDILEFDTNQLIDKIRILSVNGLLIKEVDNCQYNAINVSDLASGLYIIEFSSGEKKTVKKFIKE